MVNVSDCFNRGLNNSGYDTDCAKRFVEVTLIDAIKSGLKARPQGIGRIQKIVTITGAIKSGQNQRTQSPKLPIGKGDNHVIT